MRQGKKNQAKAKLAEMKQINQNIAELDKKKFILIDMKTKMEMGIDDKDMLDVMKTVNS